MNGEEDFHVENTVETERSLGDIGVLLLDSDDTCLVNLSEMMRKCGFQAVATTSADDVPLIINNKDEKIDLVLAEFRVIEMNKYEVLEKIRSICEIPVVDKLPQGKKRKERTNTDTGEDTEKDHGCDLGDEKKPKLICADDLQSGTLEAIPNIEEANNERKEPMESEKEKPELVCMEEELKKWSTQPVTNFAAFVEYKFEERDFQPLESVGECVGYYHEIPLSSQESSNKCIVGKLLMQKTQRALDEEVMQDGISLADLEFDLQEEGQGSTSDLEKKANQELFDEIFTDLAKELEP